MEGKPLPIYEFICLDCNEAFEVLCRMGSDDPSCISCNSNNVKKLISVSSMGGSSKGKGSDCKSTCSTKNCSSCCG